MGERVARRHTDCLGTGARLAVYTQREPGVLVAIRVWGAPGVGRCVGKRWPGWSARVFHSLYWTTEMVTVLARLQGGGPGRVV